MYVLDLNKSNHLLRTILLTISCLICQIGGFAQFSGSGTDSDPYLIYTAEQLSQIETAKSGSTFKLMADIDLTDFIDKKFGDEGWRPIYLKGKFLGNNHTISGLRINRPNENNIGLFSTISEIHNAEDDGFVSDLYLYCHDVIGCEFVGSIAGFTLNAAIKNCQIIIQDGFKVIGKSKVGGAVGRCNWLENVTVKGDVGDKTILNTENIGGIVGYGFGRRHSTAPEKINNLTFIGNVYGTKNVGGAFGQIYGSSNPWDISVTANIYAYTNVGGIVGLIGVESSNYPSVDVKDETTYLSDCFHSGEIIATGDNIGGIVGLVGLTGSISKCFHNGNIAGNNYVGGICGGGKSLKDPYSGGSIFRLSIGMSSSTTNINAYDYVGGITGCSISASIENCLFTGNIEGHNWVMGIGCNVDAKNCITHTKYIKGAERVYGIGNGSKNISICSVISASTGIACRVYPNDTENYSLSTIKVYEKGRLVDAKDGIDLTDQALRQKSTYTKLNWDFDHVWAINEGQSYPYLRMENKKQIENISFDQTALTLEIGETATLKTTISPIEASNSQLIWSSDDPSIATVDQGIIVAKKAGIAYIVAKDEKTGIKAICQVKVIYKKGYKIAFDPFKLQEESATTNISFKTNDEAVAPIKTLDFDVQFPKEWYDKSMFDVAISTERVYSTKTLTDNKDGSYHFTLTVKNESDYWGAENRKSSKVGTFTLYKESEDGTYSIINGMKLLHINKVVATDADGNAYQVAPYVGDVYVGEAIPVVENGKISYNGDYTDNGAFELLNNALKKTKADVTSVDLTNVTGLADGAKIKTTNPNALIIVSTKLPLGNEQNVVVDGTCENLELTDGYDFVAPSTFHANNANYQRTTSRTWGTICLPYAVKSDANVQYYTLTKVDAASNQMLFKSIDEVAAGTPAVYCLTNGAVGLKANATDVEIGTKADATTTDAEGWTMRGSYKAQTIDPATNANSIYYIAENKFWFADQAFNVAAFRGWFETTHNATVSQTKVFAISINDSVTDIQDANNEQATDKYVIFDLWGRQQNAPAKGQVNIINGKKVIVK